MTDFDLIPDEEFEDYRIISTYFTDFISFCRSQEVNIVVKLFYLKCLEDDIDILMDDIMVEPIQDFLLRIADESHKHYLN